MGKLKVLLFIAAKLDLQEIVDYINDGANKADPAWRKTIGVFVVKACKYC